MVDDSPSGMAYNRYINLDGIEDRIIHYLLYDKYDEYIGKDGKRHRVVKEMEGTWGIKERPVTQNDIEAQKQVQIIRRLLKYSDSYALVKGCDGYGHENVSFDEIAGLIYNQNDKQNEFRVFRSPRLENSFNEECSLLKVYIDSIIPTNRNIGIVNIGIDALSNTRIINLISPSSDDSEYYEEDEDAVCAAKLKKDEEDETTYIDSQSVKIYGKDMAIKRQKLGIPLAIAGNCEHNCNVCPKQRKKECANEFLNRLIPISYKSRVSVLTKAILHLLNGANVAGVGRLFFSRENSIYNQAQYGIWNNRNFEGMKIVMGVSMSGVS